MPRIMLVGKVAQVQLIRHPEDDVVMALCRMHVGQPRCTWTERYDTTDDAAEYASSHADAE
jgi:hypothetical protein